MANLVLAAVLVRVALLLPTEVPDRPVWLVLALAALLVLSTVVKVPLRIGRQMMTAGMAPVALAVIVVVLPPSQAVVAAVGGVSLGFARDAGRGLLKLAVNVGVNASSQALVVVVVGLVASGREPAAAVVLAVLGVTLALVDGVMLVAIRWVIAQADGRTSDRLLQWSRADLLQLRVSAAVVGVAIVTAVLAQPDSDSKVLAVPFVGLAVFALWLLGQYSHLHDAQQHLLLITRRLWDAEHVPDVLRAAFRDVDTVLPVVAVEVVAQQSSGGRSGRAPRVERWSWEDDDVVGRRGLEDAVAHTMVDAIHATAGARVLAVDEAPGTAAVRGQRLAAPFTLEDGTRAVLAVGSDRRDGLDREDHRELLHSLALQVGFALSRVRLGKALITEQAERLHDGQHDGLTHLLNRVGFTARLAELLEGARHDDGQVAIALLDLSGFARLNDTLGHAAGDEILTVVAERLRTVLRDDDTIGRLGPDVFGIALDDAIEMDRVVRAVERVLASLREHVQVAGIELALDGRVGLAIAPEHGDTAELLLRRADGALTSAKERLVPWSLHLGVDDEVGRRQLMVNGALRRAIAERRIDVHFQPKVDAEDGRPVGFEALARWEDAELGFVSPVEFIPVAEHTGQIVALTRLVLEQSLDALAAWRASGHGVSVAVNASPSVLLDDALRFEILDGLARRGLPPGALTLELTEEALLTDDRLQGAVQQLTSLGIHLAIDDYGTGHSSLRRLLDLSTDELKIDRSFVSRMVDDPQAVVIVRSTIELASGLGMMTVAEGVETEEEAALLRGFGADVLQGWLTGRPMVRTAATDWLEDTDRRWRPSAELAGLLHLRRESGTR